MFSQQAKNTHNKKESLTTSKNYQVSKKNSHNKQKISATSKLSHGSKKKILTTDKKILATIKRF